jgi:hypothetical protein
VLLQVVIMLVIDGELVLIQQELGLFHKTQMCHLLKVFKIIKIDCTTANGSLSAGWSYLIQQIFEGQNLQYLKKGTSSAESLTVSFWVKSVKLGLIFVN